MKEVTVKERKGMQEKAKDECASLRTVKVGIKTKQAQKLGSSVISVPEASIRIETKAPPQPLSIRMDAISAEVMSVSPRKGEIVSIKEGFPNLERKPVEKKETISIDEETLITSMVAPSATVKTEPLSMQSVLEPKFTSIEPMSKLQTKPLKLEEEMKLAREETSLKLVVIELPEPRIIELIKIRMQEEKAEEVPTVTVEKDIIGELIQFEDGSFSDLEVHRPLCIVVTGDDPCNGMKMIEDLMSTKYTFHGFYRFSRLTLPWQKDVAVEVRTSELAKNMEKGIYEKIVSSELIISDIVTAKEKEDVVRGLRDISNRGPKCVILYTRGIKDFKSLKLKVTGVDFKAINLPKLNDKTRKLMGMLIGVDLEHIPASSVDELWHRAIGLYEEEANELNLKLPHVPFFRERETTTHYLMKRLVYNSLKNSEEYKGKNIVVEEPLLVLNGKGGIEKVIPDIIVEGEYWEIETGYPSKDEPIMDPYDPFARLVSKLGKYQGSLKIRVVVPSIYAQMFREKIKQVKRYFKEVHDIEVKFYTLQWYEEAGIKFFI